MQQPFHDISSAKALLNAIEVTESLLHKKVRITATPDGSKEEVMVLSSIRRGVRSIVDRLEELRMDLDDWIVDYETSHPDV